METKTNEPQRIHNELSIDYAMLLALLRRCGHEIGNDVTVHWLDDEVRVEWTTPVI
jgi:hypothetical protein